MLLIAEPTVFVAGDRFEQSFTFKENGEPRDMSDKTWTCQWRRDYPGSEMRVSFAVDKSLAVDGVITISVEGPNSKTMKGTGYVDLRANEGPETFVRMYLCGLESLS